ncbi:MAG: outer membrane lipoprotein carrier protein LolA [Fimbriimonadales bacterium]
MSTFHEEDNEFQALMDHAPTSREAPSELKGRLRMMAAGSGARRPSVWASRLALAGVGAVAIAAFVISMAPSKAWSFQTIVNAVNHANSFQFSVSSNGGDGNQGVLIGIDDGKVRLKAGDGTMMQIDGAKFEIYNAKENSVLEMSLGGFVDPKMIAEKMHEGLQQGLKEMDINKMLNDFEREYGKDNIQKGPIMHRFGKSTYTVDLQKPGDSEHVHMVVSADNDLPERIEITGGRNQSEDAVIEFKFGVALDPELANFQIPANAKRVNLDLGNMIQNGIKGMGGKINGDELGKAIEGALKGMPNFKDLDHGKDRIDKSDK